MKKIVLIGDSIRLHYQPLVRRELATEALVWGPAENCRSSADILANAKEWILDHAPDIVHINCGMHVSSWAFLFMKTFIILLCTVTGAVAHWPPPKSPAIPEADGYVAIPNVALAPTKDSKYRAIFDATRPAEKATQLVPALNMAGSEMNALAAVGAPLSNAMFVIVFHGAAVDGILDNDHYKAKFGTDNPNLKTITEMKKRGVQFFVCGQYLVSEKIDPKILVPDVTVAADALLVLMQYQNKGYALMSF